jgi:hypothetical protein
MQYAGHSVTWNQFVSADGGDDVLGIGETLYYREMLVSAHMTFSANNETQAGVGQIATQTVYSTTEFKPTRRDEFVWDGVVYRVESDPQPARVGGQWTTRLTRGDE